MRTPIAETIPLQDFSRGDCKKQVFIFMPFIPLIVLLKMGGSLDYCK